MRLPEAIKYYVQQFAELYHKYRVDTERLHASKYFICSSLEHYRKTQLLQLAFNDKPGDMLPAMSIPEIKNTTDILAGLHPVDVNSINDLYYLSKDKIIEMRVEEEKIIAIQTDGSAFCYDIRNEFHPDQVHSTRLSYMMGYMQAEHVLKSTYHSLIGSNDSYKIIKDNITTLEILDKQDEKTFLRSPLDILFSGEYKKFSKEDVSKIGYICGQMSQVQSKDNMA